MFRRISINHKLTVPIFSILGTGLILFASDVYLPAMPQMAAYFHVSGDIVQMTLAAYLLSGALLGLIYGPLSDFYGRRRMYIIGITIFLIFSIGCTLAEDVCTLIIFRFLQGCGGAAAMVIGWAMVKDMFYGQQSTKIMSQISMAIVLVPAVAPIVGGHMTTALGWRSVFILLVVLAFFVWASSLIFLPETISENKLSANKRFSWIQVFKNYLKLLSNFEFLSYAVIHGAMIGGKWCFFTVAPFVFIEIMHIPTEQFGYYLACIVMAYIVGSLFTQATVRKLGNNRLMRLGVGLANTAAIAFIMIAQWYPNSPLAIMLVAAIYFGALALISPTSATSALEVFDDMKGTGASVVSCVRILLSALGAMVGGILEDVDFVATGFYLLISAVIPLLLLLRLPAKP